MSIDVILPAGGRISGEFASAAGATVKALIQIDGQSILHRTLSVLRSSDRFARIVAIGPDEIATGAHCELLDAVLPEGDSGPENIFKGLSWLSETNQGKPTDRVLVLTTDLPFLALDVLERFIDNCPESMEICLPITQREEFEARFPGSPNEYVSLSDGEWTIGCAFLLDPAVLLASREHIENIFSARKSKFAMARLLGLPFIVKYLTRRLDVECIEERCRAILGCSAGGIRGGAPELAFDLDQLEEYQYLLRNLQQCANIRRD